MNTKTKGRKKISRNMLKNMISLILFTAVMIFCTVILRNTLWSNTNQMGLSMVKNYASSIESNIRICETVLTISTQYVEERENAGISIEELREGLYPFMNGLTDIYGKDNIQIYGKTFGATQMISNDPEIESMTDYDTSVTEYYIGASKANGEIYISPAYIDAATGQTVVTMCKVIPSTGSFLAIDIKPSCFEMNGRDVILPQNASFYIADREGTLLYYKSAWDYSREGFQELVDGYIEDAECNMQTHVSENVPASDGIVRNVFFQHMDNGWTSILTIPKNEILSGADTFRYVSFLLIAVGAALFIFQSVREYRSEKRSRRLEEDHARMATQNRVYQNALNSMVRACRAIYYIDVKNRVCNTVYPFFEGGPKQESYDVEVESRFKNNIVAWEHFDQVRDFLDLSNIVNRLEGRDHIELQFKRKRVEGEGYEWCSIVVTTAEMENGQPSVITMAIRSIDDVIRREEEQKQMLALAAERAEAANHAKSDFLSRMSHDIRTPMNAILGMTAVAAMHVDEKERVLDALNKISVSGKHLLGLINEILDMSRIESGKVSLTEDAFNLSDTVENLLTMFHAQMKEKGLEINANISKLEHENVIGDEQRLQQIFMNIMGNAVKFTPSGGRINIHIEERPSHIQGRGYYAFTFEDTGIGMDSEYIQTIFEPFSRAADSRVGKIEGTGLGMPIAVNIARMMDGDIKVESELGKGSKFIVAVYLKLNDITQENIEGFASLPVLVVDDEELACESACAILESLGMDAEYALDGDSAIRRIAEAQEAAKDFSVVILDWRMPDKDGVETAREIRERFGGDIPIIILSAYDWSDIEEDAMESGVDAFISKPLFKSKLVQVLQNVLGTGEAEKEASTIETFKSQDFSGKRVLLVEDNELNTEVAVELLNTVGIRVETAANGKLAVDRVLEAEPGYFDLIFMDIQMPVMNGYEASKAIRSSGREDLTAIPIVAMTADAFADDIRKAENAGMNGHLSKPIDIRNLEQALKKWIYQS